MLKKCILILLVFMINNTNVNAETYSILKSEVDYSKTSLNLNITKYDWKIDKLRSTSTTDIYYLKKKNFILYCIVAIDDAYYIDSICDLP
jgi:hypothetical protein